MRPSSSPSSAVFTRRSFTVKAVLAAIGGIGALRTGGASAADQEEAKPLPENVSLRELMTPEQFKAAGLKKLSPEELNNLERFLKGYRDETVQNVTKQTEERVAPAGKRNQEADRKVIEAHIKGDFNGLTGRTRMLLDNGSIWQQSDTDLKIAVHLVNPEVVLVRSIFGYRMFIVGLSRPFYVKQVLL